MTDLEAIRMILANHEEELKILRAELARQRAVNAELLAWIWPGFKEKIGMVAQRDVKLIAALKEAMK